MKGLRPILLILNVAIGVSATTHFILGDNGRIQSMTDSILPMRRHYDLFSFLQHADQRDSMNKLFESMKTRKAIIDSQFVNLQSVSDVENTLHSSDVDCILKELYDVEFDFHDSIVRDVKFKDFVLTSDINTQDTRKPDCKETFPLDFSMQTFDHLEAMRNRRKLVQRQERSLIKILPENEDLDVIGTRIATGLSLNRTSWLHLNLASIFWRIKGDAYNALECGRRAIFTAPRKFRDIPLLTTGGVFHAANRSAEAAIVIQTAIAHAPNESSLHLALGNIYGSLGDYNKSIHYYDNSLKFSPSLDVARSAKHNILCNLKLENSLTALHRQLLNILTELRAYHNDQTELLSYQETLLWEDLKQMPFLSSSSDPSNSEASNYFPLNYGQSCVQKISGDQSIVSCDVFSERQMLAQKLQLDFGVGLQVLKNLENQAKDIRESLSKSKFTSDYLSRISQVSDYSKMSDVFMEPTGRPKHQNFEIKKSDQEFEDPDWPTEIFCENLVPKYVELKQHIPVYLPPDNKGFVTYLFLNELINVEPAKEHPLPWYPPTCRKPKSFDSRYIKPELLKVSAEESSPESSLKEYLINLVEGAELAEIGQRINTATKLRVAAPWVLSMLASLYWRVCGRDRNALDCLQLALDTVPQKFRDVPLVSVASINQKYDFDDEALTAIQEAFNINYVEPATNYLYGAILATRHNITGAIHHLKQCLRVKPYAMDGKALLLLQLLACDVEYQANKQDGETNVEGETTLCIGITDLPKKFADENPKVEESIMCDKDGKNCKHVRCFSVNSDSDLLSEFQSLN